MVPSLIRTTRSAMTRTFGSCVTISSARFSCFASPRKQLEDLRADMGVEVRGRLVGQEDRRHADQGAGDRHALLLSAGEVTRQETGPVGKPHGLEQAGRLAPWPRPPWFP